MENPEYHSDVPIVTGDGSHTLLHPVLTQHYHSLQGSIQESEHIFIDLGLKACLSNISGRRVNVFEMGFGTGLNALLTWRLADEWKRDISYTGIEAYPVERSVSDLLNYEDLVGKKGLSLLHNAPWTGGLLDLSDHFHFAKVNGFLRDYEDHRQYDCVYFDAFSPGSQPELWTVDVFFKMAAMLNSGGYLVTYSSKGVVQRAMKEAGFEVEKHPGPGRKREVIRAIKK